ncbi:DUF3578 domain-containing protein [Streptomyces decoyicus]|uniref:hypothetical protein n=1 Tax=Streptomyces decoyicus TaxID=249567 RepID=UPI002E178FFF
MPCRAVPANATAAAKVTNVNAAITIKAGRVAVKGNAAKVTNVNAAITIKAGRVAVKGNAAKVSWAATPRVKTFGKKLTKTQSVASAQGYYKVNLENR